MAEWAKTEPGTLIYERFILDDNKTVFVYERYTNSDAAIAHLNVFLEKYNQQFGTMVERKRFIVFGNPGDELRVILDGFSPIYCNSIGGFSRD
ncbi:MAG: hypothetical protein O2887_15530 [Bacteroidetes bacterium]|nr:hypothetical protein [Bacteroidota bacterium]MDA1121875.1 hypothetical protein [Bacteroidota bacterium]